jgi:predicted AAA+ superfamily ATPase
MKRIVDDYLTEWKSRRGRKPLVLRGARQVGKTYLVDDWGRRHFNDVIRLDLERERSLHPLFTIRDPRRLLDEIGLLKNRRIVPGQSLLFLDEIQACPAALSVLGNFRELQPDQHVIAAGSLLDFALREFAHSMPVGRIEDLYLQPLSFEEFLLATGGDRLAGLLRAYHVGDEINDAVQAAMADSLRRYLFIGGMPEAVSVHAQGGSLVDVQRIQGSITGTLQDDFGRYGTRAQQDLLHRSFTYAAQHVGKKVK